MGREVRAWEESRWEGKVGERGLRGEVRMGRKVRGGKEFLGRRKEES